MCSAQHQVERLGNQLPVLGKANSLCEVGNIGLSLQFDRDIYLFVICVCVLPDKYIPVSRLEFANGLSLLLGQ